MRFIYGIAAILLWLIAVLYVTATSGMEMASNDTLFLSVAIIAAGAMAGGD